MVALTMPRTDRDELLFDLCMALRRVPPGFSRRIAYTAGIGCTVDCRPPRPYRP
jgi:hypothetical protein